tara:strand:- start:392 stop:613 length:222 start_codon:yes stop_codon:yes gene_type:complete
MTEEQLDSLRSKLGGDWYDTWWFAIDERFDPFPLGLGEPTFFDLINKGWLEMYPPKKLTHKEYIQQFIDGNYD